MFAKRMTFLDQLELGIDSQLNLVLQLKHVHCAQMGTLGIDGDYCDNDKETLDLDIC